MAAIEFIGLSEFIEGFLEEMDVARLMVGDLLKVSTNPGWAPAIDEKPWRRNS